MAYIILIVFGIEEIDFIGYKNNIIQDSAHPLIFHFPIFSKDIINTKFVTKKDNTCRVIEKELCKEEEPTNIHQEMCQVMGPLPTYFVYFH